MMSAKYGLTGRSRPIVASEYNEAQFNDFIGSLQGNLIVLTSRETGRIIQTVVFFTPGFAY